MLHSCSKIWPTSITHISYYLHLGIQFWASRPDPIPCFVGQLSGGTTSETICTCRENQKCDYIWLNYVPTDISHDLLVASSKGGRQADHVGPNHPMAIPRSKSKMIAFEVEGRQQRPSCCVDLFRWQSRKLVFQVREDMANVLRKPKQVNSMVRREILYLLFLLCQSFFSESCARP